MRRSYGSHAPGSDSEDIQSSYLNSVVTPTQKKRILKQKMQHRISMGIELSSALSMSNTEDIEASRTIIKPKQTPLWILSLRNFMNHWLVTTIMTIVTLFALFGDDIKLAYFEKPQDIWFDNITFACLILFSVEIALNAIC